MISKSLNNTTANLRSVTSRNYIVPQAKFNLFKGSLSYSSVLVWNSIPVSIKCSKSLPKIRKTMFRMDENLINKCIIYSITLRCHLKLNLHFHFYVLSLSLSLSLSDCVCMYVVSAWVVSANF